MLFIVIYNIPIYKIYRELNNYYALINLNSFIDNKIILYQVDIENFISNINSNMFIYFNNNIYIDFLFVDLNFLNFELLNLSSFFSNFFIYNFFDFFYFLKIKKEIDFDIIYIVYFSTSVTNTNLVEFLSLQNYIYIYPAETYLSFFRLYNPTNYIIKGITIYLLSPFEINLYLYKIQCFCFDELLLYSFESIELPILFYIDSSISNYLNTESFFFLQIQILYLFILNSYYI
jgi:hypothetical protein